MIETPTRVAAIQMNSLGEVAPNLARADDLLREAARRGAKLAVLPENFALMGAHETDKWTGRGVQLDLDVAYDLGEYVRASGSDQRIPLEERRKR